MLRTATQKGRLILVAGLVAAAAAGAAALRADLMVSYGFDAAFGTRRAALPFDLAGSGSRMAGELGEDADALSLAKFEGSAPFERRPAVGDRFPIVGRDGRARTLEVVSIRPVREPLLRIASGAAPARLLLVVCRIVEAPAPEARELVRFMIEVEEAKPVTLPRPQDPLGRT